MSVPDSVGKCPPLSGEVEARAVEAACAGFIPEWGRLPNNEAQDWRSDLSHALAAAAPIIAEAAYRAGIEDARIKELEGQVETGYRAGVNAATGRVLGAVKETLDRHGAPPFAPSLDIEPAYSTLYRLVLAALTDTEGREPASVEGGRSPSAATTDSDVKTNPVEGEN